MKLVQTSPIWLKRGLWSIGILVISILALAIHLGTLYIAPESSTVPPPPKDWPTKTFRIENNTLASWFVPYSLLQPSPCVLLLHGYRSSRAGVIPIAQFLHHAGFSVFLFDFRGHGESHPAMITFGLRESEDAHNAFNWLQTHGHCTDIGVWGHSMGGAAAVLGTSPLPADAFVLDSTYATIEQATRHKILKEIGHPIADILSPLLIAQIPWRLHTSYDQLHPVNAIHHVLAPTLIIYGTQDHLAYPKEAKALFQASGAHIKELWAIPGASHSKTDSTEPEAYAHKVVSFFNTYLKR